MRLIPLLLAAAALALAGCGGGSNDNGGSSGGGGGGGGATQTETQTGGGGGGGAVAVKMQNIAFDPGTVTVKVGQKVTWTNADSVDHNVVAQSGASFSSDNFGQGGTFSFTPTKAGTIDYVCTLHPGMDGKIVVEK